tara:strand:+ start:64 stop:336 length:273 start_codon:yes stop_codon:yes gene_type:complete
MKREIDMNNEMNALIENIKEDYFKWTKGCAYARNDSGTLSEINKTMIAEFNEKITFKVNTKYIKVFTEGGSVWGLLSTLTTTRSFGRATS